MTSTQGAIAATCRCRSWLHIYLPSFVCISKVATLLC